MDLSNKLLELKILVDSICEGKNKKPISLCDQILFLCEQYTMVSPALLISKLTVAKSNIALACKTLKSEGKIEVIHNELDRRQIHYRLKDNGKKRVKEILGGINDVFRSDEITDEIYEDVCYINEFLNKKI